MPTFNEVLKDALVLDENDRAALAERLLDSLDLDGGGPVDEAEIERAWTKESVRRLEELRSGRVKAVPADEVHAGSAGAFFRSSNTP